MDVAWHHELWDGYLDQNTDLFECPVNARRVAKVFALVRSGDPSILQRRGGDRVGEREEPGIQVESSWACGDWSVPQ